MPDSIAKMDRRFSYQKLVRDFEIDSISIKRTECGIVPAFDPIVTMDCWHPRCMPPLSTQQKSGSRASAAIDSCCVVLVNRALRKGRQPGASRGKFICTDLSVLRRWRQRFRPPALAWCLLEVYTL
jgi:hypothetical protein